MTTRRGAPAAYRGYRLQALYTLDRLLTPSIYDDLVLQPEGKEDLDILQGDRLIEVVQVKSYDSLTLSDLEPNEQDSFFQRVVRLADESEQLRILLVNFGTLGPQIQKAWTSESPQRRTIVAKLNKAGLSDQGVATLLERVELKTLDENEVRERVFAFLQESLVGVDAESAFDLLSFWLYLKAEHRSPITRQEVIERITGVGRFLAERYAYHQEWFTSIIPLEKEAIDESRREALRTEYFAGIALALSIYWSISTFCAHGGFKSSKTVLHNTMSSSFMRPPVRGRQLSLSATCESTTLRPGVFVLS